MKRFTFRTILIAVFAVTTAGVGFAQKDSGGGRLAGTWDAAVTITNCATGNPIVTFLSTANFNQGGTFSGITSGTPPSLRSSERGVWAHVAGNSYRFRFKAYLFNAAGVAIGYHVITQDLELYEDNQSYASAGTTALFDMTGTQIGSSCGTTIGTRMTLD